MTDPNTMRLPDESANTVKEFAHSLLFTGHMIDSPGRRKPRFPASAESQTRAAIRAAIAAVEWKEPGTTIGLAAAASGGDLLFHECCQELGIPTRILLALSPEQFEAASVAPAGADWVKRYRTLLDRAGTVIHIMQNTNGPLEGFTENVWQRANLWMIEEAHRLAAERALLALWDRKTGDGPGGTAHFLEVARACGIRILPIIDIHSLTR